MTRRHPLNKRIPDRRRPPEPLTPADVDHLAGLARAIATAFGQVADEMAAAFRSAAAAFNKAHRAPRGGPDDYTLTR